MTTRQQLAAAARAAGERYFEDPRGCKRGHTMFYACSGSCMQCVRGDGFSEYADSRKLTGSARDIARDVWRAARQATSSTTANRIRGVLDHHGKTAVRIGLELGLSGEYVRRILNNSDFAVKDGKYWRLK